MKLLGNDYPPEKYDKELWARWDRDLASLLANAEVNGEPMGLMETLGYYLITFSAGHDTTGSYTP